MTAESTPALTPDRLAALRAGSTPTREEVLALVDEAEAVRVDRDEWRQVSRDWKARATKAEAERDGRMPVDAADGTIARLIRERDEAREEAKADRLAHWDATAEIVALKDCTYSRSEDACGECLA